MRFHLDAHAEDRELLARVRELRGVEAAGGTLLLPFERTPISLVLRATP